MIPKSSSWRTPHARAAERAIEAYRELIRKAESDLGRKLTATEENALFASRPR